MPSKFNADEVQRRLNRIANGYTKHVGSALYDELNEVELPEVQIKTPVDTGNLLSTEHVTDPEIRNNIASCSIVAGGPEAPHAMVVHEDLEVIHRTGESKYIESTLNESSGHMARRVGNRTDLNRI
jgi:hypothetical protein